jgi:hypothetical protein
MYSLICGSAGAEAMEKTSLFCTPNPVTKKNENFMSLMRIIGVPTRSKWYHAFEMMRRDKTITSARAVQLCIIV